MKCLILIIATFAVMFSQTIITTREYKVDILPKTKTINIMELINQDDGLYSVELKHISDINFKSKKRAKCELEFNILSEMAGKITVNICDSIQYINNSVMVNEQNPFIEIDSKRSAKLSGEFVFWIKGKFVDIFQELLEKSIPVIESENGVLREWYEEGQLFTEYQFKNERRHGIQKKWYKNGQLMQLYNYKNGKLNGLQQKWYNSGKLKAEWYYLNDQLHGYSKEWYPNGQQKFVKKYDYGVLLEIVESYDENGISTE